MEVNGRMDVFQASNDLTVPSYCPDLRKLSRPCMCNGQDIVVKTLYDVVRLRNKACANSALLYFALTSEIFVSTDRLTIAEMFATVQDVPINRSE
jgi:hypothetical protein